ncbi:hypothetical protein VT03_17130 [Planctomyces sp. SH-PL14]|nr:hypothetical protein VT03_17130 [Planctomyces sp. SH-PL14]
MEPVRHLKISEEEWRLLVDLEDGFNHRRYEPDGLRWRWMDWSARA